MSKYKLTDEVMEHYGVKLHQIQALKDFGDVHKGDLGGFVQSEHNLSQTGNCWVHGKARVCGDAMVYGNARVYDNAMICGNAWIGDNALVCGNAMICGDALVCGNAWVYDNTGVAK